MERSSKSLLQLRRLGGAPRPALRSLLALASPLAGECGLILLYVVSAVIFTWPLGRLLSSAVAYPGDPLINTFILSWDVHAIASGSDIYNANIFFPSRYTLTFSENLFGLVPLAALFLTFATPLATHNALLILGIAISGYGACVMGRAITHSTRCGVLAGFLYGFCAWRFVHLPHLQFAWGGFLPLLIASLVHYDRRRSTRAAVLVGAAFCVNGLTNLHYLVFSALAVFLTIVVLLIVDAQRRSAAYLGRLSLALAMSALVLTAILWPYRIAHRMYDVRGDKAETLQYSASLNNWVSATGDPEPERRVFPGYPAIAVAGIGLLSLARRTDVRPWGVIAVLFVLAGIGLSLGVRTSMYAFLFDQSLLLSGIRAPARWAVLAFLGIAILGAIAARGRGRTIVAAACALFLVPVCPSPIRWYLMPLKLSSVYDWVRRTPIRGGILELPIGDRDFYYLLGAAAHFKPIVNGASGGAPPTYVMLKQTFAGLAIPNDALSKLSRYGVSTIIVHSDALGDNALEVRRWIRAELDQGRIGYIRHFEAGLSGDYVFAVGERGNPVDDALEAFLTGRQVLPNNLGPFGILEQPLPNHEARGELEIRGWALSGSGVRAVRLWFANKSCFVDAHFSPYPGLQKVAPHHSTDSARFVARLPKRPCGGGDADVLVEITDHSGKITTLPHVWFRWE